MGIRRAAVLIMIVACPACAGTVPPPRLSPLDPADAQAPESAPPARSRLMEDAETQPAPAPSPAPSHR